MARKGFSLAALLAVALPLAACGGAQDAVDTATDAAGDAADAVTTAVTGGGRLETVLSRGTLNCGVDGGIPGFSFVDESGAYSGLDVDVCKAVAAALFDDPDAVEYRN
nr:transporter substrate-binding domain-containing protein [Leptolyngbyaceae cyanobacterium MAG.088]